ncbi:MAG: diguanylate cyclase, partial [Hyphomicrobiales bacterium]|nr:diguanylate cyclase [Hyphomicrobiales bacterium]
MTVYLCLVGQHDLRLVALAAAICGVAAFAAINLLHHVIRSEGAFRTLWLAVAALASGAGIWATHFIAMLAFNPGAPVGYNAVLTGASLAAGVAMTGLGFMTAISAAFPFARALGGAIVGIGVALMHYMGMDALEVSGSIQWDPSLVVASIILSVLLGAAALEIGLRRLTAPAVAFGALLLAAAICSLHFTAMAAASLIPGPGPIPANSIPPRWLAILVSFAALGIMLLALAALAMDLRDRRRAERESDRMRGLADAALEGLLICDDDTIVAVNASLAALIGAEEAKLIGGALAAIIPDASTRSGALAEPHRAVETMLLSASGALILVEAIRRPIVFAGRPHSAIAVRDLRDRKRAQSVIDFLAHNDALTGLANRATFNVNLEEAIAACRRGGRLAVLRFDVDRFKEVNDLFGYADADDLLRTVARCASEAIELDCLIARVGGDEFAVVVPDLTQPSQPQRIAERLFDALRVEREKGSGALALMSVSAGVAIFPDDGDDATSLMANAEAALNCAKLEGRSTYRFFEAAMGEEARERRLVEGELRNALARNELSLVFQPQARASDRAIVAFEALLRWTSPTR